MPLLIDPNKCIDCGADWIGKMSYQEKCPVCQSKNIKTA